MKAALSAIGLGAFIASACNVAFAGPTVTTTQQGTGNTAYTDQRAGDQAANSRATITQVGDNNHAGDPDALSAGIVQRNIDFSVARATIYQNGNENAATIVQNGTRHDVLADIQQAGNNNAAAILQHIVSYSNAALRQTGSNNVAMLEQSHVADLGLLATQNGSDNRMSFRQHGSSYGTPTVAQTGAGNSVWVDQHGLIGTRGVTIEQIGTWNTVTSAQRNGDSPVDAILQIGTGNGAATIQFGGGSSGIVQTGDGNLARVAQCEGANDSLITQTGNGNSADVMQAHVGSGWQSNSLFIKQIGDGSVASLRQAGHDNHAGVYQH